MQINDLTLYQLSMKSTDTSSNKNKNKDVAIALCSGAVLMPLIPMIDGDRYTCTFKNRNVAKYITGMCAVGGGIIASKLLYDKFSKSDNKTTYSTIAGACFVPLVMLVDKWSNSGGKKLKNKWFAAGALLGAAVGFLCSKINKNNIYKK